MGAEKFFDIKCRTAEIDTAAVVLVATVRALKLHGGISLAQLHKPDAMAVQCGLGNLDKHLENVIHFCETAIVALNRFADDTDAEIEVVRSHCVHRGVAFAESDHFRRGGEGAVDLAKTLLASAETTSSPFCPLYELTDSVTDKILTIAKRMYGASNVYFTKAAERDLKEIDRLGWSQLSVCMAKTHSSLSDDPRVRGRPDHFDITVEEIRANLGAGFLVVLTGDIVRMPGLPRMPRAASVDLVDGKIIGLG